MKKKWIIISAVLVFLLAKTVSASTETIEKELSYNDIKITLDGQEITPLDAAGNYVEPFIIDGTTYLPVRGISSALGLDVSWDGKAKTVILTTPARSISTGGNSIGSTQTINDLSVTFTAIRRNSGGKLFSPENGNEYLIFEFDIENNSTKEVSLSSMLSFAAYIDGYKAQLNLSGIVEDGGMQIDTTLASGRHILGIVAYEVPVNWSVAEIRFSPEIFGSDELIFSATRDQAP